MQNKITVIIFSALFFLTTSAQALAAFNWGTQINLGGGNAVYLGEGNTSLNNGGYGSWMSTVGNFGLPGGSVLGIVQNILQWLLALFSILGILAFVISGIMYLTAYGDESQAKKAKTNMQWGIMGIVIGLSGWIVLTAVNSWLAGSKTF